MNREEYKQKKTEQLLNSTSISKAVLFIHKTIKNAVSIDVDDMSDEQFAEAVSAFKAKILSEVNSLSLSLLERIVNTITKKNRITRSKLLKLNNYKAAELDAFERAIGDGNVPSVTIELEKTSNGRTQTTYIAI
jgi:transcriptional accessory protein Tex/SPT6